jgi:hypothetical protein
MRNATKTVATWLGITGALAGIEHGIFEILQGNTQPSGLMISSMGPPCVPEEIWNSCEPAITIIPNFLITGILAVLIGLITLIWSITFIQRREGGIVLILLALVLLLFGGGLFPPLICIVAGVAATRITKPLPRKSTSNLTRFGAKLWPWPLLIFLVWVIGQWFVGYFFNDFMQQAMYFGLLLILSMLPLSVFSAYAHDVRSSLQGDKNVTIQER